MSRYQRSRQLMSRAERVVAGGISSQIRRLEPAGEPLFFTRGQGALIWDADGNEYIDYMQGMGPNIFGHAPEFVTDTVAREMKHGFVFAAQFERELEVAEMAAAAVPIPECTVRFAGSGTEIVQLALRLARGWTGRSKVIKFEGHYHGWLDSVNWSIHPPISDAGDKSAPRAVGESLGMDDSVSNNLVICEWNSVERLEAAFAANSNEIAAVIMEPINANTNCIEPAPGYLEAAKAICEREGALLIFDEVITGFRVALGGAQELYGITPDLATYAKSLAAGFPVAMLAGRREVMDMLGSGDVYHGGSYNSNVMSMAAAHATLSYMQDNRETMFAEMSARGQRLMDGLRTVSAELGSALHVQGLGTVFAISFSETGKPITNYRDHAKMCDDTAYAEFAKAMMAQGVRLSSNGRMHMSTAHTDAQVDATVAAAREVLGRGINKDTQDKQDD